jgi:hypothetical protein
MKISKETIAVLKTLSAVNGNLLIKPGNKLSSISPQKNVMAEITVAEDFPKEYGIYDLSEFLGVLSVFGDPELEFKSNFAKISEGASHIKYFSAETSVLVVPTKELKFPEAEINFTLPAATLSMAIRTAGVLRSSDVTIEGNGKQIFLVVADLKNAAANSFNIAVGETDKTFKANLKVENLKMMPGEYEVSLTSKKISRFKNTAQDALFYVALEASSKM